MDPCAVPLVWGHVADVGTVKAVVTEVVTAGESATASLIAFELETGDGVGEFVDSGGVHVHAGVAICIEVAAIASLDAFPVVALLCVGVHIGLEDVLY